jgi:hypothetical protein
VSKDYEASVCGVRKRGRRTKDEEGELQKRTKWECEGRRRVGCGKNDVRGKEGKRNLREPLWTEKKGKKKNEGML